MAGIAIAPGTLQRLVATAAERLAAPVAAIRAAVVAAPVAHADETGWRVGGNLHWRHVMSTAELSAYFAHPKRGVEALDAFGLLPRFGGVPVHDHWPADLDYDGPHAFCNAHHLRELSALAETLPTQTWPQAMIAPTLRKQAVDLFQALVLTFQGTPPMPRLAMAE